MTKKQQHVRQQIGRLAVFENSVPKTSEGLAELINALDQHAHTDDHARRIVDRLLLECQFCPTPAQIYATAAMEPVFVKAPMGCVECHGTGWRSGTKMRMCTDGTKSLGKYVPVDWAARCVCERGRFLAAQSEQYAER